MQTFNAKFLQTGSIKQPFLNIIKYIKNNNGVNGIKEKLFYKINKGN